MHRAVLPPRTPIWLVSRYEDVQRLLKDERFAKNRRAAMTAEQLRKLPWVPPMFRPLERNMLDLDPPDHTRLRELVHRAFTPRLVERMKERIQELADALLDAAERRGELDLVGDYALPLTDDDHHRDPRRAGEGSGQIPPLVEGHRLGQRLQRELARLPDHLEIQPLSAEVLQGPSRRSPGRPDHRARSGPRKRATG